MSPLSKRNKAKAKVVFTLLVVSLLLEKTDNDVNKTDEVNPAVSQCTTMIDELLKSVPIAEREQIIAKVQTARIRFTKKIGKFATTDGLIGALQLLTSGYIKTKKGTRLDYIVNIFQENLDAISGAIPHDKKQSDSFTKLFKFAVNAV